MKIVCDDKIPFLRGVLEPWAQVEYLPGAQICAEAVREADALLVRTRTRCDERLLAHSRVRLIVTATIGFDHIDTEWCRRQGIEWHNCAGCNAPSVAQYLASSLALLSRRGGFRFADRTVGIVGVGHVGSRVERVARALGFKVLLCDPPRARAEGDGRFLPLDELMERADILTLHTPLVRGGCDATFHLFDAARIARLRPHQTLINSSRGEVVDNAALRRALAERRLDAALLDVWEGEPQIDTALLPLLALATPHIAGYSADGKATATAMSVQRVARFFGLPCAGWAPAVLPQPAGGTLLQLDAAALTWEQLATGALLFTCDPTADMRRLCADPAGFERQRGSYPVRREPSAYTLRVAHLPVEWGERLRALGFNVQPLE